MANAVYPLWKKSMMSGDSPDLATANVRVALIDTDVYTYSATHQYFSDLDSGSVVALSQTYLTDKVLGDDGSFDSADPTFLAVSGNVCEALILYIDSGAPASSQLMIFQDTGVTGLPVVPNGGDIVVSVDAGGWFIL
jgi:hypothetical protein